MIRKVLNNKFIILSLGLLVSLLIYYPIFFGLPIWDDHFYLFNSPLITESFNISDIIKNFTWFMSVLTQKLMYYYFENNFFYYHCTNFVLHFTNTILFYKLIQRLKIPHPLWGTVLFLLHPTMVLNVAWIIQFKTLLCAFFALTSLHLGLYANETKKYKNHFFILMIIAFALSITSKSSSLPLILVFLVATPIKRIQKKILATATLITVIGLYKLLNSPITHEGISRAVEASEFTSTLEFILYSIPQTINWYFWQAITPFPLIPIHGPLPQIMIPTTIGIMTIISGLFYLRKETIILKYLLCSLIMLLPFIGIIPAPFMTSSWVSDHHLYLVMIFFIPAICYFLDRSMNNSIKNIMKCLIISSMTFITYLNIDTVKSEENFYKTSFEANTNIAAAYHLITFYLNTERVERAQDIYLELISSPNFEDRNDSNIFWAQILEYGPILEKKN